LDQQKSIILKPTNFQLKALVMSSYEDASYFTEVQKALKDDPFVEIIRKYSCINQVNDDFKFRDVFQGTFVCTSRAYTTQDNSNAPRSTCN
jgi:hypothetical protein